MNRPKEAGYYSLGIEEEFQIINPENGELRSHVEEVLEDSGMVLKEYARREMHKSVVETGTGICCDIREARSEIIKIRTLLARVAKQKSLSIASSGTHPFSHWHHQEITEHERYHRLVEELKEVARKNLVFGLHVHVGFPDREAAIQVINAASYFIPHLMAISANSPFWLGEDTGYASYRVKVFENFPRTGAPHFFHSLGAYEDYVKLLLKTNCIDNPKKIWWDIRLHPNFDTIEYRMCDAQMTVDETIAITALLQCLTVKLHRLNQQNLTFRIYRRCYIDENRFRASRYGINGKLIDYGKQSEVPTRELIEELLEFVDDVVDEMGCRDEIRFVSQILVSGTGADRQRAAFCARESRTDLINYMIKETHYGLEVEPLLVQ